MTNLVDRGTMDAGLAEQIDRHDRALERFSISLDHNRKS
jgi:hypothetical protein